MEDITIAFEQLKSILDDLNKIGDSLRGNDLDKIRKEYHVTAVRISDTAAECSRTILRYHNSMLEQLKKKLSKFE